jgi:hypothetical protein
LAPFEKVTALRINSRSFVLRFGLNDNRTSGDKFFKTVVPETQANIIIAIF